MMVAALASPAAAMARNGQAPATGNAVLSPVERAVIGNRIRECWVSSPAPPDAKPGSVRLRITTDAGGTVRAARPIGPASALAEPATRAVLDPRCATLPLPPALLGQSHAFNITFRP